MSTAHDLKIVGFLPMANERILFMKPRSEVSMQLYS